jgi:hypothetical protein
MTNLIKNAGAWDTVRRALLKPIPGTPEGPLSHLPRISSSADWTSPQLRRVAPKPAPHIKGSRAVGVLKVGHYVGQQAALQQYGLL